MTGFEFDTTPSQGANRSAAVTACRTCDGDRFVTVRLRSPHTPKAERFYEEVAPCPDCNPIEVTYWQADGRRFHSMNSMDTRKAMTQ